MSSACSVSDGTCRSRRSAICCPSCSLFNRESEFSPDTWDEVIDAYLERSGPAVVSARLVVAAREAFARHGYAGVNVAISQRG